MIDSLDKQTQDAFPKKRGRPAAKGQPMTAAERKARSRLKAKLMTVEYADLSTYVLVEQLGKAVTAGHVTTVASITKELTKRAKANKE